MEISKTIGFEMGHRLPNHEGKCKNLHGHHYTVEVFAHGSLNTKYGSPTEGMIVDFGDLKGLMQVVIDDKLDHAFMFYEEDSLYQAIGETLRARGMKIVEVSFIPTGENIAQMILNKMNEAIALRYPNTPMPWWISKIKLWETPTSCVVVEIQ